MGFIHQLNNPEMHRPYRRCARCRRGGGGGRRSRSRPRRPPSGRSTRRLRLWGVGFGLEWCVDRSSRPKADRPACQRTRKVHHVVRHRLIVTPQPPAHLPIPPQPALAQQRLSHRRRRCRCFHWHGCHGRARRVRPVVRDHLRAGQRGEGGGGQRQEQQGGAQARCWSAWSHKIRGA